MGFESIKKGLQAARKIASPMELVQMALPASVRTRRVLNDGEPSPEGPAGLELVEALRRLRNQLEGDAYVEGGVDYARLRGAPVYAELRELSRGLSTIRATDLEDDARLGKKHNEGPQPRPSTRSACPSVHVTAKEIMRT